MAFFGGVNGSCLLRRMGLAGEVSYYGAVYYGEGESGGSVLEGMEMI